MWYCVCQTGFLQGSVAILNSELEQCGGIYSQLLLCYGKGDLSSSLFLVFLCELTVEFLLFQGLLWCPNEKVVYNLFFYIEPCFHSNYFSCSLLIMKWRVAFTFTSFCERICYTTACNKISVYSFLEINRHAKAFCRLMEDIIQILCKPCSSEEQMLALCKKSFAFEKKFAKHWSKFCKFH